MTARVAGLIAAAGESRRMGENKLVMNMVDQPVLRRSVRAVGECGLVENIFVCVHPEQMDNYRQVIGDVGRAYHLVAGGKTRQDSVWAGLQAVLEHDYERVLIHDGARPLVTRRLLEEVITSLDQHKAVTAGVPVSDTVKQVQDGKVTTTVDRTNLYVIQTPQAFHLQTIMRAHELSRRQGWTATDDAGLVERAGEEVHVVNGEASNLKLTTPADFELATRLISGEIDLRVGMGFDMHPAERGRRLVLGGVTIEHEWGLAGHSDADAVCHAIIDAMFGAAAMPDIGAHYPDDDPAYADADSMELLRQSRQLVADAGYHIRSVDVTVLADQPPIAPHVDQMRENLSQTLIIEPGRVGIKATRSEGMFAGQLFPGTAVWAIVVLRRLP